MSLPSLGVSSLDLGRSDPFERPFFYSIPMSWSRCLFGCRPWHGEPRGSDGHGLHHALKVALQAVEGGRLLEVYLVHIERAIDLDLERVNALMRPAVILGDIAAGIRSIQHDDVPERSKLAAGKADQVGAAGGAKAVAEHKIRAAYALIGHWTRGHRMAVNENRHAELALGLGYELLQCGVVGRIEPIDARRRGVDC